MAVYDIDLGPTSKPRRLRRLGLPGLPIVLVAICEFLVLGFATISLSMGYHYATLGVIDGWDRHFDLAYLVMGLFAVIDSVSGQYDLPNYMDRKTNLRRLFPTWNLTFMALLVVIFITKTSDFYSRGAILTVYSAGFFIMSATRVTLTMMVKMGARYGMIMVRRVMLVGKDAEIESFLKRYRPWALGISVVAAEPVDSGRDEQPDGETIEQIIAVARRLMPDDIILLMPWTERAMIDRLVSSFITVPVAVHLGPERVLDRFDDIRIMRVGALSTLNLMRVPMLPLELFIKRAMDLVLAVSGLIFLLPLILTVSALIKLDSTGPIIFRQRRYGFNRKAFTIFKFRTMSTMEDGPNLQQVRSNDPRVTRIGRWLRKVNMDELPQLINVIRGEMSIVGPRPHAVAHDEAFGETIDLYARRHNVKPGMTGWAQVQGYRGLTDTDEKIRGRIEHDLYYIDNWSILLDLKIIVMTVFSPKTYMNAQ